MPPSGWMRQVRRRLFGIERTMNAAATFPGSNTTGWPRSSGAGLNALRSPTGIVTFSVSRLSYPKVASYVPSSLCCTHCTKTPICVKAGGSPPHFCWNSALAVAVRVPW